MTKTKVIVFISFALVFAAGAAIGVVAERAWHRPRRPFEPFSELDLSAQQKEQMREIWSEPPERPGPAAFERREEIEREREETVRALLTDEQMAHYEELMKEYQRKLDDMSEERRTAFEQKVERTKEILTETQREKFEELIDEGQRMGRRLLPGHRRWPGHKRPDDRAGEQ